MAVFEPQLLKSLRSGYRPGVFVKDLTAGAVVGIVAIPLALAFAIASGVPPNIGLVTAVIGGFIVSLLGGSNVQIAGPTGAFIVIVSGIITKFGYQGLLVATLMAGIILLATGFFRLGNVIKYIPFPVIVGFTSGIALIIFSSQVNDFLGLGLAKVPSDFVDKWIIYGQSLGSLNVGAVALSGGAIFIMILLKKLSPKVPSALVVIVIGTIVSQVFNLRVETIGSKFGHLSDKFPSPILPNFDVTLLKDLILPAISIAMLGAIESLLSAVIADGMTGQKHNSNTELIAQGLANVVSSVFGGIPVTGAIARTATNIRNHGQTPISGIIHALVVLLALLFLGDIMALIPLSLLAGILVIIAFNMSEMHNFKLLLRGPRSEILALAATFLLTVFLDLTIAIPCGIIFALLSFIKKSKDASELSVHAGNYREQSIENDPYGLSFVKIPDKVQLVEVKGSLFFGTSEELKNHMKIKASGHEIVILKMDRVTAIDSSGVIALKEIILDLQKTKIAPILVLAHEKHLSLLTKMKLVGLTDPENFVWHLREAILRAQILLHHPQKSLLQKIEELQVHEGVDAQDPIDLINRSIPLFNMPSPEGEKYLSSTIERELMASTSVGRGICFPHPRSPVIFDSALETIHIVYLTRSIDYQALDGERVHTAIFISSVSYSNHLNTLSAFMKLMHNTDLVDRLKRQIPKAELVKFLNSKLAGK